MAGDYSRIANGVFDRYCAVLKQQGRVEIDSDWNAQIAEMLRRWTTQAADTFGPAAVPVQTTPDGFLISGISGSATDFSIGAGRCYVDGLQAEIFSGETFNGKPISYLNQPFYPEPPALTPGSGLVYLDVWEREVTAIQDPHLPDVALGGVDTTTRLQTVWQVKVLAPSTSGPALSCGMDLSTLFPASAGRISTRATAPVAPTDPCILPDEGGYRGVENRLYRVEIHHGGDASSARWKWSRDNASIVSRVTAISNGSGGAVLTVDRIGRDKVLRFAADDWVELTDDYHELLGVPGFVAQIVGAPDETSLTIKLGASVPTGAPGFDLTNPSSRHTRLIRWNQKSGVGADGLLPIKSGWVALEDGVEVKLDVDSKAPGGQFNVGDYWCFEARVADASVRELHEMPPLGIHHHYCTLATFSLPAGGPVNPSSCRVLWPPAVNATGEDGCACTICVNAHDHNAGTATIAMAVAKASQTGGRICLGPGVFNLGSAPLLLQGLRNVTLMGQGPATVLLYGGPAAAVAIGESMNLRLQDMTILAFAVGSLTSGPPQAAGVIGVYLRNSAAIAIERCGIVAASLGAATGATSAAVACAAVALDGFLLELLIRDNVLFGDIGLCKAGALGNAAALAGGAEFKPETRSVLALANVTIADNWMICGVAGVQLSDATLANGLTAYALKLALEGNRIDGPNKFGAAIEGVSLPNADIQIARNHFFVTGAGIGCAADAATIVDNFVTWTGAPANAGPAAGAVVVSSIPGGKLPINQARVLRNRIEAFAGPGVNVSGLVRACTIADNSIVNVVSYGITVTGGLASYETIVRDNEIYIVSAPSQTANSTASNATGAQASSTTVWKDIGADSPLGTQFFAGVFVASAPLASVCGNSIAAVGTEPGAVAERHGVYLADVASAIVADNRIGDIGSARASDLPCYGVRVAGSANLAAADRRSDIGVRGNEIRQASIFADQPRVFVGIDFESRAPTEIGVTASITDNCVTGHSLKPLILGRSTGQILLNGNRCAQSNAKSPAVVELDGATIIAGSNRVESQSDAAAMALTTSAGDGKTPAATVLGNIVKGQIMLNGQALSTPWSPLNIEL